MGQLFACLADLHAAGLVHRDVKPANFVLADAARRFKLVDLGAAADLRTGTNFAPAETILDPQYCPPEQVRAEQWNQHV
jgi:serine/threonine protein kinase